MEMLGAAMSARWYYQMFMEEFGPVTVEQLRDLFDEGTLGDGDLVRCETDDVWTTGASLKQSVFAGAGDRPDLAMEEIGDLSELAFEFEDSGPTARRGAYAQESTEDASSISTEPVSGSLMQSPSPIAAEAVPSVSPPPVMSPQPPADDEPVEQWFCESLGQEPQSASSVEGAASVQPQSPGSISEKSKATKPRSKRRKNVKDDDKLLDEIFDDVFNDDGPPVRSNTIAQSFAASSMTASAASSINIPTPTTPPTMSPQTPPSAAYSSPASQGSSRAAGAQLAAAAKASRSSSGSSRRSFEANPATIGILVAVMLVAAGGWYVWQNGISFGANNGNGTFDSAGAVKTLEASMDRYKAMGDNPSESEWNEFSEKTKKELGVLYKTVDDRAGATPKGAACLGATMCLLKIARIQPGNKEFVDKNLAEYERQIALAKK